MTDDELIADIIETAAGKMRLSAGGMRGQMMMPNDALEWWVAKEAMTRAHDEQQSTIDSLRGEVERLQWRLECEATLARQKIHDLTVSTENGQRHRNDTPDAEGGGH